MCFGLDLVAKWNETGTRNEKINSVPFWGPEKTSSVLATSSKELKTASRKCLGRKNERL